jgi:acetyl-CoA carboxylase carboxyltransferase component
MLICLNPYTAQRGFVDEVILPDTRRKLIKAFSMPENKVHYLIETRKYSL